MQERLTFCTFFIFHLYPENSLPGEHVIIQNESRQNFLKNPYINFDFLIEGMASRVRRKTGNFWSIFTGFKGAENNIRL